MSTHSVIPPSSAHIWGSENGCTGWPKMSAQFPAEEPSEDTLNGDAAHWLGDEAIQRGASTGKLLQPDYSKVGTLAHNNVVISEEMVEASILYANDVLSEIIKRPYAAWGTELKIQVPRVHAQNYGTTDAYLYSPVENLLIVWDFKFGRKIIEAYLNWQGINYSAGLMELLGIDGWLDQRTKLEIRIVQPRAFHRDGPIRTWYTMCVDLRAPINNLKQRAEEALSGRAKTRSGSHCVYCVARHACSAAIQGGLTLYEAVNRPIPDTLTPEELGTQFSIIKRAKAQLEYLESGMEEQIRSTLRSGGRVPGWGIETGLGKRRWSKPATEIFRFGDLLGIDLREEPKAISPEKAEKKGMPTELVSAYVERSNSGVKVVADDNNRAKQIFSRRTT